MFQGIVYSPPILETVVREHIAKASQLLGVIRTARFECLSVDSIEIVSRQCKAELDAVRISGKFAIQFAESAKEDDGEVASVVAFLLAESQCEQPAASEKAVALLCHESAEIRLAAWWGLRLASSSHIGPQLRALRERLNLSFAFAAALDILAFHRIPVQTELGAPPDEEGDEIAWLLAEAGGRMRGVWDSTHLERFVGHVSSRVREVALRASARSGLSELRSFCRDATDHDGVVEAVDFLGVVGAIEDVARLRRAVANPRLAKAAIGGLGRLGLAAGVPALFDCLAVPDLVEAAAAAIQRITGLEVPRGALPEPPKDLTEDELDFWEPVAPVDVTATREWWQANESRFDSEKRWQFGLCVSDDPLGPVFDQLPLCVRYDVYLRERALTPGTPDWELETWSWKQKNPAG